jgi:hypothetical protein
MKPYDHMALKIQKELIRKELTFKEIYKTLAKVKNFVLFIHHLNDIVFGKIKKMCKICM